MIHQPGDKPGTYERFAMLQNMLNPEPTSTGIRSGNRVIGYSAAIRLLDNGRYDKHLADGMEILACIMEAVESNWITLNIEKELILWRWLLAAVFITEELEKNGTVDVPNDTGGVDTAVIYSSKHGAISVYPGLNALHSLTILRLAPSRNTGKGRLQLALRMYQDMVL
jgi:hypothetical protein